MAKKMLWRKQAATTTSKQGSASPARAGDGRGTAMPRGYVPMRLVGDGEDEEQETAVLVPVALLKEPGMVELLEMAERQYGYGQPGVLRIPCDARRFEQLMGLDYCMAAR